MGLSSFNAMRARERARLQAQAKVENKTIDDETFKEEKEINFEPVEVTEPTVENKTIDDETFKEEKEINFEPVEVTEPTVENKTIDDETFKEEKGM